jgi:hypothetical protein
MRIGLLTGVRALRGAVRMSPLSVDVITFAREVLVHAHA